ncbi:hypothetical protein Ae168Ps1_0447c [Pseudonocardia sp. Ae168_Ps1]|uniref:DUF4333 domain-containing protein n=2 Tax=Pseudonocardia TaxID=1847 RepID=UPI00094B2771|nr:DUF4333 domain-containing protein [Pseudonocardia sp. Ae168_Ps1]OLL72075.1 hypothetical protein Ae150APs1_0453c [Pseudonocardia sp. Ae150A_Ps1]OLL78041.1 hypothetical protein Ae168Ps1_0447c [Pseudonocardia sp. Ae168_Ps1]OLL87834.1 hypothetical protein Ae263Ps1_4889 [Pseudonocardia sp. Ae263_Ps1]OLL92140.1 hypothetical protein Ae356Ps1_2037c [Pseudonocardia sp. Ae356_Ps1]
MRNDKQDGERSAMSNPQGPDRHPEDASERTGELPVWGGPPPGGWGADPESTGAWSPEQDGRDGWGGAGGAPGWADRGAGDAGWDPRTARHDASRDAGPGADPAATGAWSPQDTGSWDSRSRDTGSWDTGGRDDRGAGQDTRGGAHSAPLWGDEAPPDQGDTWAVPTGRRGGRRRAPEGPADAVPAGAPPAGYPEEPTVAQQPGDGGGWSGAGPGAEPWAPSEAVRAPAGNGKKWALAGAGVLLVAVLAVSALVWPAWLLTSHLDQTALQTGVNQVLTEDYGLQVGAVQCPDDVEVSAGTQFACQAVVDGEQVEVAGIVTSDEGDYQVNRV